MTFFLYSIFPLFWQFHDKKMFPQRKETFGLGNVEWKTKLVFFSSLIIKTKDSCNRLKDLKVIKTKSDL